MKRINCFLKSNSINTDLVILNNCTSSTNTPFINIRNSRFAWQIPQDGNADAFVLGIDSLNIDKPCVCAIVGEMGSGKSSLLSVLSNQLVRIKVSEEKEGQTEFNVQGRISYAPQGCWIQSASIRDNILFGSTYDARKYGHVVRACALAEDLQQFTGK